MDLLASLLVSIAVLSLGLALRRSQRQYEISVFARLADNAAHQYAAARLGSDARPYLYLRIIAPPALFALGWIESPVLAAAGAAAGLFLPRAYLTWLVHAQASKSEAEAGRLLQSLITGLAAGGTYLDALREARLRCEDAWLSEDLDLIIQRFLLDAPLHQTIEEVRGRTRTRNLGLIWDTLAICTANHLPTQKARALLTDLSGTVHFNVQIANEVRARSAGQRAQIWLLAVIVPGMFLYLRWVSPDLLTILDDTMVGRFFLFPLAVALEIGGVLLSLRIARVQA